jgi:hypothetical protein
MENAWQVAKTPCGFCGSRTAKITNEHVFAEWVSALFGASHDRRDVIVRHTLTRDDGARPPWFRYGIEQEVRMPCKDCNNGWTSRLENAVRPIITPMILGRRVPVLTIGDRTVISAWTIKTAMVVEFLNHRRVPRYFTQAERASFMRVPSPSHGPGTRVWLGQYSDRNDGVHGLFGFVRVPRGRPIAHISVFAIGKLAIQILVERDAAVWREASRPGPWPAVLTEIWPPIISLDGRPLLSWTPYRSMGQNGFVRAFERFVRPDAESRIHRTHDVL